MSLRDCVEKLVLEGRITKEIGRQALSFEQRAKAKVSHEIPPASHDTAAALIAAKMMGDASAERLANVTGNYVALRNIEERIMTHPFGGWSGLSDSMTRPLWMDTKAWRDLPANSILKTGQNVEGVAGATKVMAHSKFAEGIKNLKPGFWGAPARMQEIFENMVNELHGVDTGDAVSKTITKAWSGMMDWFTDEAKKSGKMFDLIENWNIPQFWTDYRVKGFGADEFRRDVLPRVEKGDITLFDRDTGRPGDDIKILDRAFTDISTQGGGINAPFSKENRTFVFSQTKGGADAYKELMSKYGYGENPYMMLFSHIERASREMGLLKVFGPNHDANYAAAKVLAKQRPDIPSSEVNKMWAGNPMRGLAHMLEREGSLDGIWKVLKGEVHPVHDTYFGSAFSALRNVTVATSLKSALPIVMAGDTVTQALAAARIGKNPISQLFDVFKPSGMLGKLSKEDAAYFHLEGHATSEFSNGVRAFEDHLSAFQITGKAATAVVKSTLLDAWGRNGKRAFSQAILNQFGRYRNLTFDELAKENLPFRRLLDQHGFEAKDWDVFKNSVTEWNNGAHLLDPNKLMDKPELYNRTMAMVQQTGAFAMHQADARIRSIEAGLPLGYTPGKPASQIAQALMQFKTFALSRMTTQMVRTLTDADMSSRVNRTAGFAVMSLLGTAAAMQALRVFQGKDMQNMKDSHFWLHVAARSGLGAIFGEMLHQALTGDKGAGELLAPVSPLGGLVTDVGRLAIDPVLRKYKVMEGKGPSRTTEGGQVAKVLRYIPNTWYGMLATERLIYDKIQQLIDPEWRRSFSRLKQRQQKEYHSGYWWAPGDTAPAHGPHYPLRH